MRSKQVTRWLTVTLTLLALLGSAALVAAQTPADGTAEPATPFEGVGTLFLLIGLAAVGVVSLVWLMRERATGDGDEDAV